MDEETDEWPIDWILVSFEESHVDLEYTPSKRKRKNKGKSLTLQLGICAKCKKHIGRGLFMHQKYCEG